MTPGIVDARGRDSAALPPAAPDACMTQSDRPHSTRTSRPPRSRRRRWLRRIGWTVSSLVIVVGLSAFLLTRSWVLRAFVEPALTRALGGEVTIRDISWDGGTSVVVNDLRLRIPDQVGLAGEFVHIEEAVVTLDPDALRARRVEPNRIAISGVRVRIAEDLDDGGFNFMDLRPPASEDTDDPAPGPDFIAVTDAIIELGAIHNGAYQASGALRVAGELTRPPDAPDQYAFQFVEFGTPAFQRPTVLKGEIDHRTRAGLVRIDSFAFDEQVRAMCPMFLRPWWDRLAPAGWMRSASLQWGADGELVATVSLEDAEMTLPIDDPDFWARFAEGDAIAVNSRPRMKIERGVMRLTDRGIELDRVIGTLTGDAAASDVVSVPFQITLDLDTAAPLRTGAAAEWTDYLINTAAFTARFRLDDFTLHNEGDGPTRAVEMPMVVARVLARFQITSLDLNTYVEVNRAAPTVGPDGRWLASPIRHRGEATIANAAGCYEEFPYPLQDVGASLTFDDERMVVHFLEGRGPGDAALRMTGEIAPVGRDAGVDLRVTARDIRLDQSIVESLPENRRGVFEYLQYEAGWERLQALDAAPDDSFIETQRVEVEAARAALRDLGPETAGEDVTVAAQRTTLRSRIERLDRSIAAGPFELGGMVDLDLKVEREVGPNQPTYVTGDFHLPQAGLIYKHFPYPFRVRNATVRWLRDKVVLMPNGGLDGLELITPSGARGYLSGEIRFDRHPDGRLKIVNDLHGAVADDRISDAFCAAIPAGPMDGPRGEAPSFSLAGRLVRGMNYQGPISYQGDIRFSEDTGRTEVDFVLDLDGGHAPFTPEFRETVEALGLSWPLDVTLTDVDGVVRVSRDDVRLINITGRRADGDVTLNGVVDHGANPTTVEARLDVEGMALERATLGFLPDAAADPLAKLWRDIDLRGRYDATVNFRADGADASIGPISVRPLRLDVQLGAERTDLTRRGGEIAIDGDVATFNNLEFGVTDAGGAPDGVIGVAGSYAVRDDALHLVGRYDDARFESDFLMSTLDRLVGEGPRLARDAFNASGRFDADFVARRVGDDRPEMTADVRPRTLQFDRRGRRLTAVFEPETLARARTDRIDLPTVNGAIDDDAFELTGAVTLGATPEVRLAGAYVTGTGLSAPLRALAPTTVGEAHDALETSIPTPIAVTIDELILRRASERGLSDPWDVQFRGVADVKGAALRAGAKFTDVNARLDITASGGPDRDTRFEMDVESPTMRLTRRVLENTAARFELDPATNCIAVEAEGSMYGGLVSADGFIGVDDEVDYELDVQFADIGLGPYAAAGESSPDAELRGRMFGRLMLSGDRRDRSTLVGRGSLRIGEARIPLSPGAIVLQMIHLAPPVGSVLDRVDSEFFLVGDVAHVERVVLESPTLRLTGAGTLNLETLEVDAMLQSRGRIWVLSDLASPVGELFSIEVTGTLSDPKSRVIGRDRSPVPGGAPPLVLQPADL